MSKIVTNNKIILLSIILAIVIVSQSEVYAEIHTVNFTNPQPIGPQDYSNLVVQVLKYDPYPVSAGEWFDVWIKVQNLGQEDAKDVRFKLISSYPFSIEDNAIRDYGIVFGTVNSYKSGSGDDANQVILHYRVKAADNAPIGDSDLQLQIMNNKNDPSSQGVIRDLPISIGDTKTNFEVVMQDTSSQGVSFAIANIGDNAATAVTVSIKNTEGLNLTGSRSSIIGNLDKGDFTSVNFPITLHQRINSLTVQIDYTDSAGVRNTLQKEVPVTYNPLNAYNSQTTTRSSKTNPYTKYIYLIIGLVIGIIIMLLFKRKKRN